jgi:sugar diacid utilization regulator
VLRRRRGDRGRRVARILAGDVSDGDDLGYDLSLEHLAVVAWGAEAATRVKALALRAGRHVLLVDGPGDNVWAWLGGQGELHEDEVADLIRWQRNEGGHIAFGESASGVDGFRVSHGQAVQTRAVALARGDTAVRYDDVALIAMTSHDRNLAAAFVAHELRDLAASDIRSRELRETLRVYLENGQSVNATQALRGLNRNTVRHHLDEAQAKLRHRIVDRSAELLFAMRLLNVNEA